MSSYWSTAKIFLLVVSMYLDIVYKFIYIYIYVLEKEMSTHSSILAWRSPWTEEAGRLHIYVYTYVYLSTHTYTYIRFKNIMKNLFKINTFLH